MAKLTILRGVSGSGKSTWARQQNAVVVSRDSLRVALFGGDGPEYYASPTLKDWEDTVTRVHDVAISASLRAGKDVIVDNTNIEWKYVKAIAKIGHRHGAEVEVMTFDVPLMRAINNNTYRAAQGGRDVPRHIIEKQHSRLQGTKDKVLDAVHKPKPYSGTPGKPKAVLVDIDGTLAHMRDYRSPYDWKSVGRDDPDFDVMQVITWINLGMRAEYRYPHQEAAKVILMSGRDAVCRQETLDWLTSWDFGEFHKLFMRPEGDMRPDNIVKAELFDQYVRDNYDVVMVFDDRNQVVDMWRDMGVKVAQVAEGDF